MDRVHYRRVKPSRLNKGAERTRYDHQANEEPTAAETLILQSIVCGVLIVCVLLISLTNLAPAAAIRENLQQLLTGAETPQQLLNDARYFGEEFFGWGAEPEDEQENTLPPPEQAGQESPILPLPPPSPLTEIIEPLAYIPSPTATPSPPAQTWITPVSGRISSPSGNRYNPVTGRREFHDGIDIAVPTGTQIVAPKAGEVIASGFCPGFGYFMRLSHENNYISFYGHLSRRVAALGDFVSQGEHVAYSGNTGQSTGPHLHFGIFRNGQFIDPLTRVNP
ncbi:MAG: M23 family metallopeptidase [Defluviitaleaceae bacterium]|nr:M23 family metallopeptidase [Defluviitaleaceae bacterium]